MIINDIPVSGTDLTPLIIVELLLLRMACLIPWGIVVPYGKELIPTNLRYVDIIYLSILIKLKGDRNLCHANVRESRKRFASNQNQFIHSIF